VGLYGILSIKVGRNGMKIKKKVFIGFWGKRKYKLKVFVLCDSRIREKVKVRK